MNALIGSNMVPVGDAYRLSVKACDVVWGKRLADLDVVDNELVLRFDDGSGLKLYDSAQMCCESRYMNTDDDLSYHVGATLQNIEVRPGPGVDGNYVTECEFLVVTTSMGAFTVANYNCHNGYYGGFSIAAAPLEH